MKLNHLVIAILVLSLAHLYVDQRELRANFTTASQYLANKTELLQTAPMVDYGLEIIGDGVETAAAVSFWGNEINVADGNIPKPYATWALFRSGGTRANKSKVLDGMVMGALSWDGWYTGGLGQAEAARIMAIACQDWNTSNSKCTDIYFAPTGLNEGHVRNMFKMSRLEGLKALDNYAVLDLSVIEAGRRTMAFRSTTDVPTLAPAGLIEIELDGRPGYIQVVR